MFGSDRDQLRQFYVNAWQQAQSNAPLDALTQQVVEVIREHPEYHSMLEDPDAALSHEFTPEQGQVNPFLHMGMHLALREQVSTNRPEGILRVHQQGSAKYGQMDMEHRMMECLGKAMWEAQRLNRAPDEDAYLDCLKKL